MAKSLLILYLSLCVFSVYANDGNCNSNLTVIPNDVDNKITIEVSNNFEYYDYTLLGWINNSYKVVSEGRTNNIHIVLNNLEDNVVYKIEINFIEREGLCQFRQKGGIIL